MTDDHDTNDSERTYRVRLARPRAGWDVHVDSGPFIDPIPAATDDELVDVLAELKRHDYRPAASGAFAPADFRSDPPPGPLERVYWNFIREQARIRARIAARVGDHTEARRLNLLADSAGTAAGAAGTEYDRSKP